MKPLLLLFFHVFSLSFSQQLMEVAVSGKSKIIYEKPFQFKIKKGKWSLKYKMELLSEQKHQSKNSEILADSLIVIELCENAKKQNLRNWSNEEFDNAFLIDNPEFLSFKKIKNALKLTEKSEIKKLRKQISQFNNYKRKWRSFPLSVSRPIYTNDNEYALIAFDYGNNGGEIVIYRKDKKTWVNVGVIKGWGY